jgi:hypothetical protein
MRRSYRCLVPFSAFTRVCNELACHMSRCSHEGHGCSLWPLGMHRVPSERTQGARVPAFATATSTTATNANYQHYLATRRDHWEGWR